MINKNKKILCVETKDIGSKYTRLGSKTVDFVAKLCYFINEIN